MESVPTRYVVYAFTCPKGHKNNREGMVFAETEGKASNAVLAQRLECEVCGAPLADKSVVEISENRAMPSIPSDL
jgi:hypothetical protein